MRLLHRASLLATRNMRRMLFFLFPLFLNLILYLNLLPPPSLAARTPRFAFDLPGVLRFMLSLLLIALVYLLLTLLVKRPWLAALVLSLPLYVISVVDFYKFYALGTRIAAEDIAMVFSLADLWSPKGAAGNGLFFSPLLFATAPLLLLYIHYLRVLRVGDAVQFHGKRVVGSVLAAWLLLSFSTNSLAYQIFDPQVQAYKVVPSSSDDAPQLSSIDCLIGSVYYDDFTDDRATEENVRRLLTPYKAQGASSLRPDIIVVMSESYFDLNRVQGLTLRQDIYSNFRRMQRAGATGRIVVPAFGGGTASTEFEVLSGTSNAALQSTRSPYGGIGPRDSLPTFRRYLGALGYESSYLHPFKGSFYNRENAMQAMGFDHILFQEDFTVPLRPYPRDMHVSDETLTDQILAQLLHGAADRPQFVWATSMQNHTPYVTLDEQDPILVSAPAGTLSPGELDGLNAYAVGIRDTDAALGRLLDYVDSASRPTALLFFGDHQPLLEGYKRLNTIANDTLYEDLDNLTTDYAIYSNFNAPMATIGGTPANRTDAPFSAYYLMDVLVTALGMPKPAYMTLLDDAFVHLPVYSTVIRQGGPDPAETQRCKDLLDILSYDRVLGDQWSSGSEIYTQA